MLRNLELLMAIWALFVSRILMRLPVLMAENEQLEIVSFPPPRLRSKLCPAFSSILVAVMPDIVEESVRTVPVAMTKIVELAVFMLSKTKFDQFRCSMLPEIPMEVSWEAEFMDLKEMLER